MFITKKYTVGWNNKLYCLLLLLLAPLPAEPRTAAADPLREKAMELLSSTRSLTLGSIAGGRLTTESGAPIPQNERVAQPTIYYTPYVGSKITLYTGTNWQIFNFSELSIAVPAGSSGDMYDVFIYSNSGTPTLELTAWTNSTTRAVALAYFEGVRVKSGDSTRRYLGSFSLSGSGITEESWTAALVYNQLNQTERPLYRQNLVDNHSYDGPLRAFNGDTANKIDFVLGEQGALSGAIGLGITNPGTGATPYFAVGFDSYTIASGGASAFDAAYGQRNTPTPTIVYVPGRHFLSILESTDSNGPADFMFYTFVGTLFN
jgi:hypothetical protein